MPSPSSPSVFFVLDQGKEFGPYVEQDMAGFVERSQLHGASLVRPSEQPQATRLDAVLPHLFLNFPSHAPLSSSPFSGLAHMTTSQAAVRVNPTAVLKWSWAAFLWGPFWALYHRVWWGALGFVPYLNIAINICLGLIGRKQAWENGAWASVDKMHESDRKWVKAMLALVVVGILILSVVFGF